MNKMPDMPYIPNDSMNLMGLYFPQSSPTARILAQMRRAIFLKPKEIPYSLVRESQDEIAEMRLDIDSTTPYFQQGINSLVFKDGNKRNGNGIRTIFLTTADYLGPSREVVTADYLGPSREVVRKDVVIPRNLGANPWPLYRGEGGYDSVDTRITAEQAVEYIGANVAALKRLGVERVFVKTSCFFYVRDEDLRKNGFIMADGQVDLDSLVTYLVDTNGMVGVKEVQKPEAEEYAERAVPSASSRQKQTLEQKVRRELCQYDPIEDAGDAISDWGGHRITAATEQEAIYWGTVFGSNARVGTFRTEVLHVDNYYEKPKDTGFKSLNLALRVIPALRDIPIRANSPRHKSTVRELQIYDLQQHFDGQINRKSPAYHERFRRSETESSKKRQKLMDRFEYTDILKFMFNARELEFPVRS